ncbi:MAG: AIR carboxylase family protein [Nanoarchaeota archaeon]|nr:AIR carboxylase family protein [Nanoarchaeota archaeon]
MSKALVIFASKGDEESFAPILKGLEMHKIPYDFHLCSVHRTPHKLMPLLEGEYDFVISGAGLSAALPGAIAAAITKPVIGVPCSGSYQGLDAFLSVMQMPPGIPVLGVGVNRGEAAVASALKLTRPYHDVNIIGEQHSRAQERCEQTLREFDVSFRSTHKIEKNAVNIEFVSLDETLPEKNDLVIQVPLLLDDDDTAEAALNVLKHAQNNLWVGLNNGVNAAIAAIQIMNKDGKYNGYLKEYREHRKLMKGDDNEQ